MAHLVVNRRDLLKSGAVLPSLLTGLGKYNRFSSYSPIPKSTPYDPGDVEQLIRRGLDVASASGSDYTDIRLTHVFRRRFQSGGSFGGRGSRGNFGSMSEDEFMTVGVRCLRNGYWGFSCSSVWSADEMARLAKEAASQARMNSLGKARAVNLAPMREVPEGRWTMPVEMNPFDVHPLDAVEYLASLKIYAERLKSVMASIAADIEQQDKYFGASNGGRFRQTTYSTGAKIEISIGPYREMVPGLEVAGLGWEYLVKQPLRQRIDETVELIRSDMELPIDPVNVGRYTTIVNAPGVANLLAPTIGEAAELDRALGFEANASGTSYINEPFEMIGKFQVGGPRLQVSANRGEHGGLATVRWDDEGVQSEEYVLVNQGVLACMHTNRETAGLLADATPASAGLVRSTGCAAANAGEYAPLTRCPNLRMVAPREEGSFDDMIRDLRSGIAMRDCTSDVDFQQLNGMGLIGGGYVIRNGKRVARIGRMGFLFRSPELWKSLIHVGGSAHAYRVAHLNDKGQPPQESGASVWGVPCTFENLSVIDLTRKA